MKLKTLPILATLLLCGLLSGCGTFRPVTDIPVGGNASAIKKFAAAVLTRATMDDFVWKATVAEPSVDLAMELANDSGNPDVAAAISVAIAAHLIEANGPRVLRLKLVGEGEAAKPRVFICRAKMAMDCELPVGTGVTVYAHPVSLGNLGVLVVDRISKGQ